MRPRRGARSAPMVTRRQPGCIHRIVDEVTEDLLDAIGVGAAVMTTQDSVGPLIWKSR